MASVSLKSVHVSYPLLGAGVRKKSHAESMEAAGSVIRDESRSSRSILALDDVSLELRDGDRLGIVGRNGSGKSTLLRVIAGIFEPMSGYVRVEGAVSSLFNVGLGINQEATGYRNIQILGTVAGYSRSKIAELTPQIEDFCELGEYLNLPVRTYSNGMAMRLKFACATAFAPDILILDEWLGAGDPEFKQKTRERMRELVDQAGILVLASHSQKMVREECNKILWLHKGKTVAIGPTAEIFDLMIEARHAPWDSEQLQRAKRKLAKNSA